MKLGFTGTRIFAVNRDLPMITTADWLWIGQFDSFVSGACMGFDTAIALSLLTDPVLSTSNQQVIVPADWSRVDPWWNGLKEAPRGSLEITYMPYGSTYRERNEEIVYRSHALFYFADQPENHPSSRRSGTWMTVRMARKKGIPTRGIIRSAG